MRTFTIALGSFAALGVVLAIACSSGSGSGETGPGPTPNPSPTGTQPGPAPTSTGTGEPAPPDPGPPAIQFIGRFDTRDATGPVAGWPGARIIANFEGTAVTARLKEEQMPDGPSEWDVAVDGQWQPRMTLQVGDHTYDLAKDLPAGKHTIELYKNTESQTGVTQFLGYDFHGGTLLPPPLRASRHLEIVGDSDVAGYGYEGAGQPGNCGGEAWLAKYQNFRAAWGQRLTDKLSADLEGVVFSGKGFYYNAWRPDTETIDVLYPRSNPEDTSSTYDLKRDTPDVVVIAIGGNDYNVGEPDDTGPAPLDGFTEKARTFTGMLRTNYPQAHIFLMAYAVLTDDDPPGRLKRTSVVTAYNTVVNERNAAGDARVYFAAPPTADYTELTACDGHGGPEYHERIATWLETQIREKTGWK